VEIPGFSLFITTGFDQILESALREVRSVKPSSISYSPNFPSDLDIAGSAASQPTVFHLCGRPEFSPSSCAVTGDEWQIFSEALISPERRPWRLIAGLRERVLLFLGGGHPSGFLSSFLRLVRLSNSTPSRPVLMGLSALDGDPTVLQSLQPLGGGTTVFADSGGMTFVEELHRRLSRSVP
jgi:hypothetical protein